MIFANVRELKAKASEYIRQAQRTGGVVVTSHGKPAAALIPLNDETFDDYVLEHHKGIRQSIEKAFSEYKKKGGKSVDTLIEETRRELGR